MLLESPSPGLWQWVVVASHAWQSPQKREQHFCLYHLLSADTEMSPQGLFVREADEGRLVQGVNQKRWIFAPSCLLNGVSFHAGSLLGIKQPQSSNPILFTMSEEEYSSSLLTVCALGEFSDFSHAYRVKMLQRSRRRSSTVGDGISIPHSMSILGCNIRMVGFVALQAKHPSFSPP